VYLHLKNKRPNLSLDTLHAYAEILDKVGTYVYTKNILGEYTYANELVCKLFERSLDNVIGQTDIQLFGIESAARLKANDAKVMQAGQTIETTESLFIKALNQIRTFWAVKSPLKDDNGEINGLLGVSTDITHQVNLQKKASAQSTLLDSVLNNLEDFIGLKDNEQRYLYINQAGAKKLGTTVAEAIGKTDKAILENTVSSAFDRLERQSLDTMSKVAEEITVGEGVNKEFFWSVRIPLELEDGSPGVVGISSNVTELSRLKEDFKKLALTDSLTGISNRRHILDVAETELKRMHRWNETMAILVIDIDAFKTINDSYGHQMGDNAIIAITEACKNNIRDIDHFGRTGGDEFLVISPKCNRSEAELLAKRLQDAVNNIILKDNSGNYIRTTCSFGCVVSEPGDATFSHLLAEADIAMYESKSNGRNKITFT
jgi:diguanylate cyclase (GGDEF)-like protein